MLRHIQPALTMPMSARKNIRIGISKITPRPTMMVRNRELYSLSVIIGWNSLP